MNRQPSRKEKTVKNPQSAIRNPQSSGYVGRILNMVTRGLRTMSSAVSVHGTIKEGDRIIAGNVEIASAGCGAIIVRVGSDAVTVRPGDRPGEHRFHFYGDGGRVPTVELADAIACDVPILSFGQGDKRCDVRDKELADALQIFGRGSGIPAGIVSDNSSNYDAARV
jgi:hypothetical protein